MKLIYAVVISILIGVGQVYSADPYISSILRDLFSSYYGNPWSHGTDPVSHDDITYCKLFSDVNGDVTRGASRTITHDVSDLEEIGWKHVVSGIECYGLWVLYKVPNYNADGTGGVGYVFKETPEYVPFTGDLWSHWNNLLVGLRRVGPSYDPFTTDSISLYEHEWFSGEQYYTESDVPRMPMRMNNKVTSVIITGNSNWTIYDEAEFGGKSECLRNEPDGSASFKSLLVLAQKVTSVKKGCN